MSSKPSRHSINPASPSPQPGPSKLPKFLQKQSRDRSKSVTDPTNSTTSLASSASTSSELPSGPPIPKSRKSSKFLPVRDEKQRRLTDSPTDVEEPPVIIEPASIRTRTRSERPNSLSSDQQQHLALYSSTSSTSRISDFPTRLSGWFSHTFSTSSTDLSLPSILGQTSQSMASPKSKGAAALLTAAKQGKGHLDKAMRYLLDSDATPDKCADPIWLLGVQHPGYEPPPDPLPTSTRLSSSPSAPPISGSPPSFRSSTSSVASSSEYASLSQSTNSSKQPNPAAHWPPVFYLDFTSRVWLTYRSHFQAPIRDVRLADLCADPAAAALESMSTSAKSRPWNWIGEKTWTSDSGWGCMLRTGQSLLANALIHHHLGRDWRKPPYPVHTSDYATYVQILTWFLDTPSPEAPFSVHRMALAGKELGTDVGQWFGPSVAAGAIKTLVQSFPEAGFGVSVATDGVLFQSDVYAASYPDGNEHSPSRRVKVSSWGHQPVLLLLGIRLGIDGVNPIYYETIKLLYTFPQSVGIAGGRPSSSYYFVGAQADNLFYLDPHHARPAVSLRSPPPHQRHDRPSSPESDWESTRAKNYRTSLSHQRVPTSPSSVKTGSSTFSYHAPMSPSPLQHQFSSSSTGSSSNYNHNSWSPPPSNTHVQWRPGNDSQPASPSQVGHADLTEFGLAIAERERQGLDPLQEHYVTAYSAAELKTFHCERVRKMPLSGLDPSMLIGFLCRDEADWLDFKKRVSELPRTIFAVQDEPPSWPSDSDDNMGLESISDPDDLDLDDDEEGERFFEPRSGSASISSASVSQHGASESKSEDLDTEEDPVDPVTPGPGSKFEIRDSGHLKKREKQTEEVAFDDDVDRLDNEIEDDWVDPSVPAPTPTEPRPPPVPAKDSPSSIPIPPVPRVRTTSLSGKKSSRKKKQTPVPVPTVKIPSVPVQEHYPFPQTPAEDVVPMPLERARKQSTKGTNAKRMNNARARDGGRTQSGGVKGIVTED